MTSTSMIRQPLTQEVAPAALGLGISGLVYGLGGAVVGCPIGFSGSFLFGATAGFADKCIRTVINACLNATHSAKKISAKAVEVFGFIGATGAAWGVLAMTGCRLSLYYTVTLTVATIAVQTGIWLTHKAVETVITIEPKAAACN